MTLPTEQPPRSDDPGCLSYIIFAIVAAWIVVIAVQVVSWVLDWPFPPWHVQLLVVTVVLAAAHLVVMPRWDRDCASAVPANWMYVPAGS